MIYRDHALFLVQIKFVCHVRFGSFSTDFPRPRHFRFPPHSDQIADVPGLGSCHRRRHGTSLADRI
jgi:hypothetical protein